MRTVAQAEKHVERKLPLIASSRGSIRSVKVWSHYISILQNFSALNRDKGLESLINVGFISQMSHLDPLMNTVGLNNKISSC